MREKKKHFQSISILPRSSPSDKLLMVGTLKELSEAIIVIGHGTHHSLAIQEFKKWMLGHRGEFRLYDYR